MLCRGSFLRYFHFRAIGPTTNLSYFLFLYATGARVRSFTLLDCGASSPLKAASPALSPSLRRPLLSPLNFTLILSFVFGRKTDIQHSTTKDFFSILHLNRFFCYLQKNNHGQHGMAPGASPRTSRRRLVLEPHLIAAIARSGLKEPGQRST